jgi:hypothetical protein
LCEKRLEVLCFPGHLGNYLPDIHFLMVNHLCTQRLLKLRLKWAQAVQYKEVANFGILHMMLVFRSAECKTYGVIEASIKILTKPGRSSSLLSPQIAIERSLELRSQHQVSGCWT